MRRLMLLSVMTCTTWLGCSDDPEPPPNPGPTDESVRIRSFNRYLTASGFEELPTDFAKSPVELFVVDGDNLTPVAGSSGEPGEYVFPDVPRAPYYLKVGTNYIVTDSREVDLSTHVLGRSDTVLLEDDSMVSLALSGLEPWFEPDPPFPSNPANPRSELRVVAEQLGYSGFIWPNVQTGATSANVEDEYLFGETGPMPRFEADRGDRAWVMQLNPRELGPLPGGGTQSYLTAVRALQLPPFSHDGTAPLHLEGTLQPLMLNQFALDWRVSSFAAQAAEVHPSATLQSSYFSLFPVAYGPAEGWVGYSSELLNLRRPPQEASDATGTLVYGNPFPSSWGMVASATSGFSVSYDIPGDAQPFRAGASIAVSDRPGVLGGSPILPRIGPPRSLTLDGEAAYTARTVGAGTHVLAWQPPGSGTATAYTVTLRRLDKTSDSAPRRGVPAGTLYVNGSTTSVRLPAGMLQPGQHYYLAVRAVHASRYDVTNKPLTLIEQLDYSSAQALSGLLSVPAE